ncbi:MAG: VCBS repeat-containing protein [Cyclobacteriaceae bacterium]|nr:VCBS repeat-containing protein [Cyclobacteriaceae bacterium]
MCVKISLIGVLPMLLIATSSFSQPFELSHEFTPGLRGGEIIWGDLNNDGRLDFIQTGNDIDAHSTTRLFLNNGSGFTEVATSLPQILEGAADWGDYDNDGDQDLLIAGSSLGQVVTKIFKNEGGVLTVNNNIILHGIDRGSVEWGDYDADGDLDILLSGQDMNSSSVSIIYQNNNNSFQEVFKDQLTGVSFGESSWVDYDGDGDLDILISGVTGTSLNTGPSVTKLYENNGSSFLEKFENNFENLSYSAMDFGDYDNDGDLDILLSGSTNSNTAFTALYQNNKESGFETVHDGIFPPIIEGKVLWIDYDNDGDLDVFISGNIITNNEKIAQLYTNNGNGFDFEYSLAEAGQSAADIGDFDSDGDLDLFISGQRNDFNIYSAIYKNINTNEALSANPNSAPTTPTNLSSNVNSDKAILTWIKSTDNETNQDALTYNIYLRNELDTIKSPLSLENGKRKILKRGNTGSQTTYQFNNLSPGNYYWSVQAIDNSFAGSGFTEEQSFTVDPPIVTGVELDHENNRFTIYPNPAKNKLTIEAKEIIGPVNAELYDLHGRLLSKNIFIPSQDMQLELNEASPGMYILKLREKYSETVIKVIIE